MLRTRPSPHADRSSNAAFVALKVPPRSMSITVLNPFGDRPAAGTRKLPAAPLTSVSSLPNLSAVARIARAIANVGGEAEHRASRLGRELLGGLRNHVLFAADDRDVGPEPRIRVCDASADAGATAGDEHHVTGKRVAAEDVESTGHAGSLHELRNRARAVVSDFANPKCTRLPTTAPTSMGPYRRSDRCVPPPGRAGRRAPSRSRSVCLRLPRRRSRSRTAPRSIRTTRATTPSSSRS